MKTPRKTHPQAPLFYPPQVDLQQEQEQVDQLSVDFTQLTGAASDAQVPQSAVTQHQAALALSFTQMTDNPTAPQKANIMTSPVMTGTPSAPTPAPGDNTTKVATTAFVTAAVAAGGGGGGSSPARGDVVVTTASLADGATENGTIALGKSSLIVRFQSSHPCRIRLYSTVAYRTADAARIAGVDPQGEHGLQLEIVVILGNQTWDLDPKASCSNDDDPASTNIYYAIQNMNGATATITVTITRVPLET